MTKESRHLHGRKLIAQKLFQVLARLALASFVLGGRHVLAARDFKVLAVVGHVLLSDLIRAAVPALIRDPRVVADAIEANLQVGTARMAGLGSARTTG